jgi:hypothetical protein
MPSSKNPMTFAALAAVLALACKPRAEEEPASGNEGGPRSPGRDRTDPGAPGSGGAGGPSPGSVSAGLPPPGPTGYLELEGEVVRLTPEQISRHLERTFGWTQRSSNVNGIESDYLIEGVGVALGGIDYKLASNRDPFPRTQTVLISRMLAWQVAVDVVLSHADPARSPKIRIFDRVDIDKDRPEGESAGRWDAQLDDLYWRMFSRAPSPEERLACRNAFLILMDRHEHNTVVAWIGVLYALISTMEFWVL